MQEGCLEEFAGGVQWVDLLQLRALYTAAQEAVPPGISTELQVPRVSEITI